ncbi:MAG: hypothetical protein H7835_06335 [Magnetococcus sp. XQGC-1]
MDIRDIALSLQDDHAVVLGMLRRIKAYEHEKTAEDLVILKRLLINHFLVERFCFYSYGNEKKEEFRFEAIGNNIVTLIDECIDDPNVAGFEERIEIIIALIEKRVRYEDTMLLRYADTHGVDPGYHAPIPW